MKNVFRLVFMSKIFKRKYIVLLILALISTALASFTPYITGVVIDEMIYGQTQFVRVLQIAGILFAIYTVCEFINYRVSILATQGCHHAMMTIRRAMMDKLMRLPYSTLDKFQSGDLVMRMNFDIDNLANGVVQGSLSIVRGIGLIILTIFIMLSLNIKIGIAVIILTPLSILVAYIITKNSQKYFKAHAEAMSKIISYSQENMESQKAILSNGFEGQVEEEFDEIVEKWEPTSDKSHFFSALVNPAARLVNNSIYIVAGMLGVILGLSVGSISSFLLYATQYAKPFNEISAVVGEVQTAIASANRVAYLMDKENVPENAINELGDNARNINFNDVTFSYSKDFDLIKNLTFDVKEGEKVAIVGTTGAGKTTLINLLLRFYDVQKGSVTIGGVDIRNVSYEELRSNISVVPQECYIENGTVHQNIAFGKNLSREKIIEISKKARCYSFITRLENGFDTIIDKDSLAQGEMQLICIARAMAENASILILDEATSAIDSLTEVKVQKAFDELMIGKTAFIIAHRLSTIRNADKILVMDNGNVVEMGNHQSLMQAKGLYYHLNIVGFSN